MSAPISASIAAPISAPMSWLPTGYAGLVLGLIAVVLTVGLVHSIRSRRSTQVSSLRGVRGWHVVDDIAVDAGTDDAHPGRTAQVDHLVVAPAAVLAIVTENRCHVEQQRCDQSCTDHSCTGCTDIDVAERAAARVREFLRDRRAGDAVVVPVVWASGPDAPADGHRLVDGVHVVDGDNPGAWLHLFRDARLAGPDRMRLCSELDRHVRTRRIRPRARRPVGPVPPPAAADAA